MFINEVSFFHGVGVFLATRFHFQFCFVRSSGGNQPIHSHFVIGFDFDRALLSFERPTINNQPANYQAFGFQRWKHRHWLIRVVIDDARNSDLIAYDEEARCLQAHNQRLFGTR